MQTGRMWVVHQGRHGSDRWYDLADPKSEAHMKKIDWRGVFPAMVTHFNSDLSLDISAMKRHADAMLKSGVTGFIFLGTLGENCSLEYGEKMELLAAMAQHVKGRVPVMSGVAEYTTKLACKFAADAKKAGCDGL